MKLDGVVDVDKTEVGDVPEDDTATVLGLWPTDGDDDSDGEDGDEDPGWLDDSESEEDNIAGEADLRDDEPDTTPDPPKPDKFREKMFELERACQFAEREVEEAKVAKKEADVVYARAVADLRNYIRNIYSDMDRPLFNTLKKDKPPEPAEPAKPSEPANNHAELMLQPIDVLDLPGGIALKLEEAHVQTVGHLEKLRGEIALGNEKWPKGIGPAKVTTIEDAVTDWIAANYQESGASGNEAEKIETEVDDDGEEESGKA